MTYSLQEIALVMEKENMGFSSTKYILESLGKLKNETSVEKFLTLEEALENDEEARKIAKNLNSKLRYRVITLYTYLLSKGIRCSFNASELEEFTKN